MKIFTKRVRSGNGYTYTNGIETSDWTIILDAGHNCTTNESSKCGFYVDSNNFVMTPQMKDVANRLLWEYKWNRLVVYILYNIFSELGFKTYMTVPGPGGIRPSGGTEDPDIEARRNRINSIILDKNLCPNSDKTICLSIHLNGTSGGYLYGITHNLQWSFICKGRGEVGLRKKIMNRTLIGEEAIAAQHKIAAAVNESLERNPHSVALGTKIFFELKKIFEQTDSIYKLYDINPSNLIYNGFDEADGYFNKDAVYFKDSVVEKSATDNMKKLADSYKLLKDEYVSNGKSENTAAKFKNFLILLFSQKLNDNLIPNIDAGVSGVISNSNRAKACILTENFFMDGITHNKFLRSIPGLITIAKAHIYGVIDYCINYNSSLKNIAGTFAKVDSPNYTTVTKLDYNKFGNISIENVKYIDTDNDTDNNEKQLTNKINSYFTFNNTPCVCVPAFLHWSQIKPTMFFDIYINNLSDNQSAGSSNLDNIKNYSFINYCNKFYVNKFTNTSEDPDKVWDKWKNDPTKYHKELEAELAWRKLALMDIYSSKGKKLLQHLSTSSISPTDDRYILLINSMSNFYKYSEAIRKKVNGKNYTYYIKSENKLQSYLGRNQDVFFEFSYENVKPNQILYNSDTPSPITT